VYELLDLKDNKTDDSDYSIRIVMMNDILYIIIIYNRILFNMEHNIVPTSSMCMIITLKGTTYMHNLRTHKRTHNTQTHNTHTNAYIHTYTHTHKRTTRLLVTNTHTYIRADARWLPTLANAYAPKRTHTYIHRRTQTPGRLLVTNTHIPTYAPAHVGYQHNTQTRTQYTKK